MRSQFEAVGWTWHPYHGDPTPVPVGAVMLNITHHTECVVDWDHLAGAHMDEVGDIVGRIAGDQTGAEISVVPWYEYWDGWDGWLEPPADNVPVPAAPAPTPSGTKDLETVAMEVKAGLWGNNPERAEALKAAGYDYPTVQQRVNETIANSNVNSGNVAPAPDLDPIAWMIIRGQGGYGNNPERAERLTRDGYDAAAVQQRVNQLLS
jgi:hypothetical protein